MIHEIDTNISELQIIQSDLAAQFPVYIYMPDDRRFALHSTSIKELLDDDRVIKPLDISYEGLSFLLQSRVVPPPKTIFKNIYLIGIGDTATLRKQNNCLTIEFDHSFPFLNSMREEEGNFEVDDQLILELLAEATISQLNPERESILFHSAGKDSNSIALALAEVGYQDKITLLTHKSKGADDESEISKSIAKKLGFAHKILQEPQELSALHRDSIERYFINIPLPLLDTVGMAYPLYAVQMDFQNKNIIDGSGNDVHMGHVPNKTEYDRQKYSSVLSLFRPLSGFFPSGSRVQAATRTRAEWPGLSGLTFRDTKILLGENAVNVSPHWKENSKKYEKFDYFDYRTYIRGTIIDTEVYTRKIKNFSDTEGFNLILPWSSPKVAKYFSKMPENIVFDRKHFRNKVILRRILKERLNLDSDAIGKRAYSFDHWGVYGKMRKDIINEILECDLWNKSGVSKIIHRSIKNIDGNIRVPQNKEIFLRIYLISVWYNKNKYVGKIT